MSDNSNNSESVSAAQEKKQFWVKIATIAFLLIVALVKPQVDVWLAANGVVDNDQLANNNNARDSVIADEDDSAAMEREFDAVTSDGRDSRKTKLGTLRISDPNDSITRAATSGGAFGSGGKTAVAETGTKLHPTFGEDDAILPQSPDTKSSAKLFQRRSTSESLASAGTMERDAQTRPERNTSKPNGETDQPLGKLTLTNKSRDEFRSSAGLIYVRGSEDGHRLKHVLKHAKDDLSKPVHGVYSGDRDQILAWIDQTYLKGRSGGKGTRVERQGGRTVYTVDLGEEIGFVGGQAGKRKHNPPCHYLRLVVQNLNEVVTAYPLQSL